MRSTLISYRTHADKAADNQRAVEAVFVELGQKNPAGLHYVALRGPDDTFYHLVLSEADAPPMTELDAFRAFQDGVRARCADLPRAVELTMVGDYRMVRP